MLYGIVYELDHHWRKNVGTVVQTYKGLEKIKVIFGKGQKIKKNGCAC